MFKCSGVDVRVVMIISLQQPQFAPNLYDLSAMHRADRVILLDEDQWSRKGRTHRARITEAEWINIPIKTEDKKRRFVRYASIIARIGLHRFGMGFTTIITQPLGSIILKTN